MFVIFSSYIKNSHLLLEIHWIETGNKLKMNEGEKLSM